MADKIKLEIIPRSLSKNQGNQAQENHKIKANTNLRNSCYLFNYRKSFRYKRNAK